MQLRLNFFQAEQARIVIILKGIQTTFTVVNTEALLSQKNEYESGGLHKEDIIMIIWTKMAKILYYFCAVIKIHFLTFSAFYAFVYILLVAMFIKATLCNFLTLK